MKETKDPAIKLFGQKIPLPIDDEMILQLSVTHGVLIGEEDTTETDKDSQPPTFVINSDTEENDDPPPERETNSPNVNPKTPSIHENRLTKPKHNDEKEKDEAEEKTLKKPDKILPCPRCNSMDTKFCYYNNYNVNQPRHFCKACQRYWTAGGTMRNVPVGAGRRKNKNSAAAAAANYRHITISDPFQPHRIEPTVAANTKVLSFGGQGRENGEDCTSASSITMSNSAEETCVRTESVNMAAPWPPYPWFFPYWNCAAAATAWNMPWFPTPPTMTTTQSCFSPNGLGLGKHPREGSGDGREEALRKRNGGVLVPKTLRIDDPSEAAKSSIWATLGIKNEGVGMFKGFGSKSDKEKKVKSSVVEPSMAYMANPAALSRSINFHESA